VTALSLRPVRAVVGSESDPFHGDRLGRKKSVELLADLVATVSEPFVLSVEGSWGTGKSTFLRMLGATLKQRRHPTFFFNAWDNDFATDPLVALMGELDSQFEAVAKQFKAGATAGSRWGKTVDAAANVGSALVPILIRAGTAGMVGLNDLGALKDAIEKAGDGVADLSAEVLREQIENHSNHHKAIAKFRKKFVETGKSLASAKEAAQLPIVVFIDELDRCKPTFAVALLERVKHVLNVPGVCFVLAVDRDQLSTSVQMLYGERTDATGYLRRFIDLEYQLPVASPKEFVSSLFDHVNMNQVVAGRKDGSHEVAMLLRLLPELSVVFGLSLRDQERVVLVVELAFRLAGSDFIVPAPLLAICAVLRVRRTDTYRSYIAGESAETVLRLLAETEAGKGLLNRPEGKELEVYLRLASALESDRSPFVQYTNRTWSGTDPDRADDHDRRVEIGSRILQLRGVPEFHDSTSWMRLQVAKMVDLTEAFVRS
jgi:hypothetical protein